MKGQVASSGSDCTDIVQLGAIKVRQTFPNHSASDQSNPIAVKHLASNSDRSLRTLHSEVRGVMGVKHRNALDNAFQNDVLLQRSLTTKGRISNGLESSLENDEPKAG